MIFVSSLQNCFPQSKKDSPMHKATATHRSRGKRKYQQFFYLQYFRIIPWTFIRTHTTTLISTSTSTTKNIWQLAGSNPEKGWQIEVWKTKCKAIHILSFRQNCSYVQECFSFFSNNYIFRKLTDL